ncbi:MAG: hypothetical protein MJA84_16075, partial [Firmicutes bacterium]|nr:hypothetical protein [Bacillota bacterium]
FNNINYKGMYIVDSFGSISNYELERLLYIFDKNIKKDALLGFHSHNNMQLAYSNSINFINGITNREIITDSSIYGMGRGAGNLNTELLADYLNKNKQANYKLTNILEVIEFYIESIYNKNPWGFSLVHFLSATKGCHPNYASFFANKKISVVCIQEVLNDLDKDKKSVFDKEYAQKIYTEYIMKV